MSLLPYTGSIGPYYPVVPWVPSAVSACVPAFKEPVYILLSCAPYANRVLGAYYRSADRMGHLAEQPSAPELWASDEGRYYVVLRNVRGVLAVYGVSDCDDTLHRLKRWPSALNEC